MAARTPRPLPRLNERAKSACLPVRKRLSLSVLLGITALLLAPPAFSQPDVVYGYYHKGELIKLNLSKRYVALRDDDAATRGFALRQSLR